VRRASISRQGMTLLEIMMVLVILMLGASGLSFSLGALARANLKAAAGKLGAAARFSYNRAVTHGQTVRIHFVLPGNTFSIQSAHAGITLASSRDKEEMSRPGVDEAAGAAVDPWSAAQARIQQPQQPTLGASPFSPIASSGKSAARYTDVSLGRGVQFLKLIVAHEPEPLTEGDGSVHFFPGGHTEHAIIQLGDGRDAVYSVEIHPLTGRVKVYPEAYEPDELLDNPDDRDVSEVDEP
jgi:general secretion pathway protein H